MGNYEQNKYAYTIPAQAHMLKTSAPQTIHIENQKLFYRIIKPTAPLNFSDNELESFSSKEDLRI